MHEGMVECTFCRKWFHHDCMNSADNGECHGQYIVLQLESAQPLMMILQFHRTLSVLHDALPIPYHF